MSKPSEKKLGQIFEQMDLKLWFIVLPNLTSLHMHFDFESAYNCILSRGQTAAHCCSSRYFPANPVRYMHFLLKLKMWVPNFHRVNGTLLFKLLLAHRLPTTRLKKQTRLYLFVSWSFANCTMVWILSLSSKCCLRQTSSHTGPKIDPFWVHLIPLGEGYPVERIYQSNLIYGRISRPPC